MAKNIGTDCTNDEMRISGIKLLFRIHPLIKQTNVLTFFLLQKLDDEWKSDLMALPNISNVVGNDLIKTSELLILLLRVMSKTKWGTSCIWMVGLKNYISSMKKLSLEINIEVRLQPKQEEALLTVRYPGHVVRNYTINLFPFLSRINLR